MSSPKLPPNKVNSYLDAVAVFMCKHIPGYADLPAEALNKLDDVWLALADNRTEFIKVLDEVKSNRARKKNVATTTV